MGPGLFLQGNPSELQSAEWELPVAERPPSDKPGDLPVNFGIRLQQLCWTVYCFMCTGM